MSLNRTLSIATAVFLIDRITKWIVVEYLDLATRQFIPVAPPYLNLTMAWNTGINFGLFGGDTEIMRYLLIVVALVIVAGVLIWARKRSGWLIPLAAGVLIGGALGNVLDRVIYGAVADFLNTSCCGFRNPFAFNIADIAIFSGAILLILFGERKDGRKK